MEGIEIKIKTNVTDADLLKDLKSVAKKIGKKTVSAKEYSQNGIYGVTTFRRKFGTWNNALCKAELELTEIPRFISNEKLMENLILVWEKLGRQPNYGEVQNPLSQYSMSTYENRFNGWTNTLIFFKNWLNHNNKILIKSEKTATKRKSRKIDLRLRFQVLERDKFTCQSCGASPAKGDIVKLHIDHIVPYSKGGETRIENLQVKCNRCNLGKSNIFNK